MLIQRDFRTIAIHLVVALWLGIFFPFVTPVEAQTRDWIDPFGGLWVDPGNWNPADVPDSSGETAQFNLPDPMTIQFNPSSSTTIGDLLIPQGDLLFQNAGVTDATLNFSGSLFLEGGDLTLARSGAVADVNLNITNVLDGLISVKGDSEFRIAEGAQVDADFLFISSVLGFGNGTLIVENAGSSLDILDPLNPMFCGGPGNTGHLIVRDSATASFNGKLRLTNSAGDGGTGIVDVLTGGDITANHDVELAVAFPATGNSATINVIGGGSTFTQNGASRLTVGSTSGNNTGLVNVTTGGEFSTGTDTIDVRPDGTISIDTGGTFNANGNVTVDGGTISLGASSNFNLASGLTLTAKNGAQIDFDEIYTISNNTTFDIQSDADFSTTTYLDIGNSSVGTLYVNGIGTTLTTGAESWWGANGGTATVTIGSQATATLSDIVVAQSDIPNTNGNWTVEGGAYVTSGSIGIANAGPTSGSGTVIVTGAGSTIVQNAPAILTIGHSSNGTAELTIADFGTFTTGAGETTVNAKGTLNVGVSNEGTFNAIGNVTVDSGTINRGSNGTFNLGNGLTLTAQNNADINFTGNYSIEDDTTFNILLGAGFSTTGYLDVGFGSSGTLLVDGIGSSLSAGSVSQWGYDGNTANVTISDQATADLGTIFVALGNTSTTANWNVVSGAQATVDDLFIATDGPTGGSGSVLVTGPGSTITQNGPASLTVGHVLNGVAELTVAESGTFTTGFGATTVKAAGTVNIGVSDEGTFNALGNVTVDGGTINRGFNGDFNLTSGLTLTAQNNANLNFTGFYTIDDGTTLDIQTGASFTSNSVLNVGMLTGNGTLLVDTANVITSPTGISVWGEDGFTADVTFRNNAIGNLSSIFLGQDAFDGGTAIFNVESNSLVTTGNLDVASLGGSAASGTINVDGLKTSLAQTGASTLTLGHASESIGTINLTNNGSFHTGTGTTTINATGIVNIDGGVFSVNGPIVGNGAVNLNTGHLSINDPTQSVGFGTSNLRIGGLTTAALPLFDSSTSMSVIGTAIVEPGANLAVQGGDVSFGNLTVLGAGTVTYQSGALDTGIVQAAVGSVLDMQANVSLGNASAVNGFGSAGTLLVHDNTVTLEDANDAVFDSLALVTLGEVSNPGTLVAANGITLDFGGNFTGYGTVDTPDNAATQVINNGHISGNSGAEPITLTGYVKGVGTCDFCNITGTDAPGFSPAAVSRGSVSYNGTLEIEIGGTSPGSSFDQLNHILGLGIADLGGTLDVQLIDDFMASYGDTFEIITATAVLGTFDVEVLPTLAGALQLLVDYQSTSVSLLVGLAGDFDIDGDVDGADFLMWQLGFGTIYDADDLADWEANYGAVAPLSERSAAVPEPNSLALLSLGGILVLHSLRRATSFTA